MKSLLKTFERKAMKARYDVRNELANSPATVVGSYTRDRVEDGAPGDARWLRSVRRNQEARVAVACRRGGGGTDDLRVLERCTYNEDGLTGNRRLRGGSCRTTEVHAQVAVAVSVRTLTEAVRRKGTQRYDQRDGRDKRDQTNTEKTPAQGELPVKGRISVACERPAGNLRDTIGRLKLP